MSYWNLLVIILSVTLAAYLVWTALRPRVTPGSGIGSTAPVRRSALVKIIVSLVAVASLACLGTGVYYQEEIRTGNSNPVVIVTPGTSADSLDMLRVENDRLYTFNPQLANTRDKIRLIHSFSEIADAGTIHITGYGMEPEQVDEAVHYPLNFVLHPPQLQNNFESVNWNQSLRSGEQLIVSGKFNNKVSGTPLSTNASGSTKLKILLEGFGTPLDSVMLPHSGDGRFALHCFPKQQGRAVYSLKVLSGSRILQQQKIPFETVATDPLKILVLSASPDFENRFLKTWLFSSNYGIVLRSMVSKNKFVRESVNMEDVNTGNINPAVLAGFDLVISDATALAAMPFSQLSSLRNAVEQSGLGMIMKADSITARSLFYNRAFNLSQSSVTNKQQVELHAPDSSVNFPALTIERPILIESNAENRGIYSDKNGHHFAASAIAGSGKLVYTSINNSFSWVLGGDSLSYRLYWSTLIQEAAKRKNRQQFFLRPGMPVVNEQSQLYFETGDTVPFRAAVNGSVMPLRQDPLIPFRWNTVYWPAKPGWQQTLLKDDQVINWYVFGKNEWQDLANKSRISSNRGLASLNKHQKLKPVDAPITRRSQVPKFYFIIIFTICCFYLWIQEKYYNSRN